MLLALIVNTFGFLQILTQTFYSLHQKKVKGNHLEVLLVRWILLILIILLDNLCLGVAEILPFGTYVYNYYKLMVFISKNDFHVSMMQKFIVKADPDVLGEFFLTMIARVMIRIMHKSCMVLKRLNLPVSQTDFNLSQEIMEFLEEYHPRIIKTSTNLNNTSLIDQSLIDTPTEVEKQLEKMKEEERKRRKLEKLKQEKIIEEEIQRQQEELLKLKQKKLQEIKGIYEESDNSDIDQKKRGKDQEEDLIPKRDLSNDGKKSSSKTNNSITKIQKPSQQLPIKTQTTASTTGQNVVNKAIKNRYAEQEDEEQYDEDDVINNIDFNDSSSKQEDSSNEKVYAPVNVQTQQQNRILPDLLVDDDFELLQQGEQTNYRDGDTVKKKEIVGVKKSTIKTSSGLPPSSRSQAQTVTEQIPRFKTTQNQNSLLTSNQTINLTKSVRSNSGLKDRSEIPLTNNVEPSTLRSAASYKSKYTNNLALSTTLAQTRNHLDETKTKFEQYKQKYGNNNKFNQNYSLIDKDD